MVWGAMLVSSGAKKKSSPRDKTSNRADPKAARRSVGDALRSAYQEAVDEEVPSELLDLLGKLG